jgi:hypothetical protein
MSLIPGGEEIIQDADGTWHFNAKSFAAVGFTPPAPLEIKYLCLIHPDMEGTVKVG